MGPFDTSRDYFEALLRIRKEPTDPFNVGILHHLGMMIECIPRPVKTAQEDHESFVLSHPDFDSQNLLVSEDGTLTAVLDWDNVHTVPRCMGYSRYPAWITRDWYPLMYGYGSSIECLENSPEELDFFRQHYAETIGTSISDDFQSKSHLFEALGIAASSPMCTDHIVMKIFETVFPDDEKEDADEQMILYDVAMDLADDTIQEATKMRMKKAFAEFFDVRGEVTRI